MNSIDRSSIANTQGIKNRKMVFYMVVLFLFAICLYVPEISAQLTIRYRIQIKALDRVKIDSLKLLCKSEAEQLNMAVYILDQDNYYKMAVGNFSSFRQASEKLEFVSSFYHDAWIIPAYNELIIFSVDPPQNIENLPEKQQETEQLVSEEIEPPVMDQSESPEPFIEELLPVDIPEDINGPDADTSNLERPEPINVPELPDRKKIFWKLYGSGAYIDLHSSDQENRYCTYYGYGAGAGVFYAFTQNLALDLSAGYSTGNAVALNEKHNLTGKASVFIVNPSLVVASGFYSKHGIYGKVGAAYFNYDYAYKLELKPGFSGGPASVETELLQRAATYGLNLAVGFRVFRNFDASFHTWFDQNSRYFYQLNLGIVF
jgi:hypothetical protein